MKTKARISLVAAVGIGIAMATMVAMPASATVVTFQNGNNAYTGCEAGAGASTKIDYNWGGVANLYMSSVYNSYLKFNNMGIPKGSTINSATIRVWGRDGEGAGQTVIQTITVLKDWNQGTGSDTAANSGEVTWKSARHNQELWGTLGGTSATDLAPVVDSSKIYATRPGAWEYHDVTASLQQQADSGNFYGWRFSYISGGANANFNADNTGATYSPKLTVDYTPPYKGTVISIK